MSIIIYEKEEYQDNIIHGVISTTWCVQVLGDCSARWAGLTPHLASAEGLARLVGLDAPPSDAEDERGRARRTLLHALTLVLGVVKRTRVPPDPDKVTRRLCGHIANQFPTQHYNAIVLETVSNVAVLTSEL